MTRRFVWSPQIQLFIWLAPGKAEFNEKAIDGFGTCRASRAALAVGGNPIGRTDVDRERNTFTFLALFLLKKPLKSLQLTDKGGFLRPERFVGVGGRMVAGIRPGHDVTPAAKCAAGRCL